MKVSFETTDELSFNDGHALMQLINETKGIINIKTDDILEAPRPQAAAPLSAHRKPRKITGRRKGQVPTTVSLVMLRALRKAGGSLPFEKLAREIVKKNFSKNSKSYGLGELRKKGWATKDDNNYYTITEAGKAFMTSDKTLSHYPEETGENV